VGESLLLSEKKERWKKDLLLSWNSLIRWELGFFFQGTKEKVGTGGVCIRKKEKVRKKACFYQELKGKMGRGLLVPARELKDTTGNGLSCKGTPR
jgi:hypothetical protein